MKGRDQKSAFAAVREEVENFNTAWRWLIEKNQIETAVDHLLPALFYDTEIRDLALEMLLLREISSEVLTTQQDRLVRSRWEFALNAAMVIPGRFGTYEEIAFGIQKDDLQRVWSMLEKQKDSFPVDFWGIRLAYAYGNFEHAETAIRYLELALPELEGANKSWELATSYLYLAKLQFPELSYSRRNEAVLERYILAALEIFNTLGDGLNVSYARLQLGSLRYKQERLEEAVEQWRLAQAALKNLEEWLIANNMIRLIGDAYLQMGKFENAFQCFDQIARISFEHGHAQQAVGALSKESFEMVRYGDLAEASRLRQQCIEIIEASGPPYQIGWNYWEMGEILRVMGDLDEAGKWYERARKAFEATFPDDVWKIFYYRGSGDIALVRGDFTSAAQQFLLSAEFAQVTRHAWATAYALNGLGRSEVGLQNSKAARQHFLEALQYAFKTGDHGIALVTLAGYAELLCQESAPDMAVQLGSLVSNHYATWRETRDSAARLLSALKKTMTADEFEQARKDGQAMDLQETLGNLIAWQKPPD
jgi:tetratricopeptide (TPR) repeat protein